ncbi:MAG: PQQ-like beta-propeller repeat protein [Candidatus Poribacteria bacterium]|nr:PQQ-like beta-propeller repeat protein [Candidatus Poribacteria bacterium]
MKQIASIFLVLITVISIQIQFAIADDWSQWRGENRDGVWKETGIIEKFDGTDIPHRWSVPVGSGYSGPSVADGRVYITDRLTKPKQVERVHCFDWETGDEIWSHTYDCVYKIEYPVGPRANVTVDDGLAYALGAMGHLHCYDAATGEIKWKKDLNSEYNINMPIWGIACAPIIDENLVIVQIGGKPEACVVAFDRKTGEEKWKALSDNASYSAPIMITQAGKRVLICWTGHNVAALDPQTGDVHWKYPIPPTRWEIGIATPIVKNNQLFVTNFYEGAYLLELANDELDVELVWHKQGKNEKNTKAIQTTMSTPIWLGDYIYGVDSHGEVRCINAQNGDRIWEDLTAVPKARWSTIHFVKNADKVWMFNEKGELLITELSPEGLNIISRAKLIEPTRGQLNRRGGVTWSHPAFAYKHVFARNDKELICANLEKIKE